MSGVALLLSLAWPTVVAADVPTTHADSRLKSAGLPPAFHPRHFNEGPRFFLGPLWWRRGDTARSAAGLELGLGFTSSTRQRGLHLEGVVEQALRALGPESYSLSLGRHVLVGGVHIGPLDINAGAGASLLNIDVIDGRWGVGLLSPVAVARLGLQLGRYRFAVSPHVTYLWRWNQPDIWVRGFSFSIARHLPPRSGRGVSPRE